MQTRSQQVAAQVYACVQARKAEWPADSNAHRKEYGSLAHSLPMLVRRAGLAQAVAFVQTRGKVSTRALLDDLADVVEMGDGDHLSQQCRAVNVVEYMRLTRRVLAALDWFKRDAETVLNVKASEANLEAGGEK